MKRAAFVLCIVSFGLFTAVGTMQSQKIDGWQDITIYKNTASDVRQAVTHADPTVESEYPPLAATVFFLVDAVPYAGFTQAWVGLIILALLGSAAYAALRFTPRDAVFLLAACALMPLLLSSELTFARYDILVMFPLFLTWKAHQRGRYMDSGTFLMIAACLKLVPIVAVPLLLTATPRGHRRQAVQGLVIGSVIGVCVPLFIMGIGGFVSNVSHLLEYHSHRGIQAESMWSGLHVLFSNLRGEKVTMENSFMSMNNPHLGAWVLHLSTLLTLLASGVIALLPLFGKNDHASSGRGKYSVLLPATILCVLALGPVLSPQYFVWIVPLLLVHAFDTLADRKREAGMAPLFLAFGIGFLTRWIFPDHYGAFLDQHTLLPAAVLVARNALVLMTAAYLACEPFAGLARSVHGRLRRTRVFRLLGSPPSWRRSTAIVAAGLACVCAFWWAVSPHFTDVRYVYDGEPEVVDHLPFFVPTLAQGLTVDANMSLGLVYPMLYTVRPDDCIEEFTINDERLPSETGEFCEYGAGRTLNLSPYLRPGENRIHLRIKDTGGIGGINIGMSRFDPLAAILLLLLAGLAGWYVWALSCTTRLRQHPEISFILFAGIVLRLVYVWSTSIGTRAHDMDGHVEYIRYILSHWAIPAAQTGWEFHQPPLYYFLAAVWVKLQTLVGIGLFNAVLSLQFVSLAMSVGVLILGVWIAFMLFPEQRRAPARTLFTALIATFPGLIYVSARVSNDAPAHFLSFACFALLLWWWKTGRLRDWYLFGAVTAVALLTKVSAVALIGPAALCFLLRPGLTFPRKLLHGAGLFALIGVLAGWLPVVRLLIEADASRTLMLGNQGMHGGLEVTGSIWRFLIFNPYQVLATTFNNTWSDELRRQFFWEFFFKSGFFGEYQFPALRMLCAGILSLGLLMIPPGLLGFARSWKDRQAVPVLLSGLAVLAAAAGYAWKFRYAPNQDFRFSVLLIAPIAYLVAQGCDVLPWRQARVVARSAVLALCVACALFTLLLFVTG